MKKYLLPILTATAVLGVCLVFLLRESPSSLPDSVPDSPELAVPASPELKEAVVDGVTAAEEAPEPTKAVLSLEEGRANISGRVVDQAGQPVPAADVLLFRARPEAELLLADSPAGRGRDELRDLQELGKKVRGEWSEGPRITCDDEGRFHFSGLSAGSYRVVARHASYRPDSSRLLALEDSSAVEDVVLQLREGEGLRGVVLNTDMEAVSGAKLRARWDPDEEDLLQYQDASPEDILELMTARESGEVVSAEDGSFFFDGLVEGDYIIFAEAKTYSAARLEDVPAGEDDIQVVLRPELVVRGWVSDPEDKPIARARVQLTHLSEDSSSFRSVFRNFRARRGGSDFARFKTESDEEGAFVLGGLPYGTFRVEVEHDSHQSVVNPFLGLSEESAEDERELYFSLPTGHRIVGVVRNEEDEGISGVRVVARAVEKENSEEQENQTPERRMRNRWTRHMKHFSSRREDSRTKTDGQGRFVLNRLPEGLYDVEFQSSEFRSDKKKEVATDGEALEVVLSAGLVLRGEVIDDESEEPISDARLTLSPADGERRGRRRWRRGRDSENLRGRSDEKGRFEFHGLDAKSYELRVQAAGFVQEEISDIAASGEEDLVARLRRSGRVVGTVHDKSGSPLENVRVRLARSKKEDDGEWRQQMWRIDYLGPTALTAEDGSYEIPVLREAESVRVVAQSESHLPGRSEVVTLEDPSSEIDDIDLSLLEAAKVVGTVTDSSDLPLGGAEVRVQVVEDENASEGGRRRGRGRWRGVRASGETDGLGRFELAGLDTGSYQLTVRAAGHLKYVSDAFDIALGNQKNFDVALEQEWSIAGTVFSSDGNSLFGAMVYTVVDMKDSRSNFWRGKPTMTGPVGAFRIGRLEKGVYSVRGGARGHASSLVRDVPVDTTDVEIVLHPLVTLEGVAIGNPSGQPVAEFMARMKPVSADELSFLEKREVERWRSFKDGEFVFDEIPPGKYTLDLRAQSYLPVESLEVSLTPGQQEASIEVSVEEGGVITGLVFEPGGEPLEGVSVQTLLKKVDPSTGKSSFAPLPSASGQDRRGRGRGRADGGGRGGRRGRDGGREKRERLRALRNGVTTTGADGSFALRGIPAGTFKVVVSHEVFVTTEIPGELVIDRDESGYLTAAEAASVTLREGATIRGKVVAAGGELGDVSVRTKISFSEKSTFVDSQGRFELRGLAPGTYQLQAQSFPPRDGGRAGLDVTVPEGHTSVDGVEIRVE